MSTKLIPPEWAFATLVAQFVSMEPVLRKHYKKKQMNLYYPHFSPPSPPHLPTLSHPSPPPQPPFPHENMETNLVLHQIKLLPSPPPILLALSLP